MILVGDKVAIEAELLMRIYKDTDVPVPKVQGWSTAVDNPLGPSPFVIMDFMESVSL